MTQMKNWLLFSHIVNGQAHLNNWVAGLHSSHAINVLAPSYRICTKYTLKSEQKLPDRTLK